MKFTASILAILVMIAASLAAANPPAAGNAWIESVKDFSAHVQLGQYKEALAAFERAKEAGRTPKVGAEFGLPPHQLPNLVLVYERTGNIEKALAAIKTIRALPADPAPRYLDYTFSKIEPKMTNAAVKAEVKKLIAELPPQQKSKR